MDDAKSQVPVGTDSETPVAVFLHGGSGDLSYSTRLTAEAFPGMRLFSHAPLEGVEQTPVGLDDFGALCTTIASRAPGQPLLVLSQDLEPQADGLSSLLSLARERGEPALYTAFSNAEPDLNPFAGLDAKATDGDQRSKLVALLGGGRLNSLNFWPKSVLLLTADAVTELAEAGLSWRQAAARLRAKGVVPQLADWIWIDAPGRPVSTEARLDPHEERRPRPWGTLSERLQAWLASLARRPEIGDQLPRLGSKPVTLHITHSWGGGVATWVASMIDGDSDGLHLQLRSEGPQTGQGAGQRLSLYLGNQLETPLASWWLQPAIIAIADERTQYQELLGELRRRYGVGRIIVSSLIGHSIDALRTDCPTVQVLHDAFPAWPLLSLHPEAFNHDLAAALVDPRSQEQFPELLQADWERIIAAYAEAAHGIARVAPSEAARRVQAAVEPGVQEADIRLIPHGLPPMPLAAIEARPRQDGKLQVVIPGRVQSGKGADLLEAALPGLSEFAHITLLGTGKGGERFFGHSGVNVVPQYDRERLADLMTALGPDLALLPSTVPETFSYTLSEMHALGIPVVATAVGSFLERIVDGENGWRVAPEADALVKQLKALAANREQLAQVRTQLADQAPRSMETMIRDYDALCPAEPSRAPVPECPLPPMQLAEAQAGSLKDQLRRANTARTLLRAEADEEKALVDERTRWAEQEKRERKALGGALKQTQGKLDEVLKVLDLSSQKLKAAKAERDRTLAEMADQAEELASRAAHIESLDVCIETLRRDLGLREAEVENLKIIEARLEQVLNSNSWKLMMPFRVGRRMVANFFHLRAWNPLRWPLLASQTARNLSTVGLAGTLNRMQHFAPDTIAPQRTVPEEPLEVPEEILLPEALPCSEQPRVSIIIPAYNHLAHTAACLRSLASTRCDTAFEVIVLDDASSDETPALLAELPGLRFFRNEQNLGFIGTCNRGAEAARGDYVLFLNNDTQVTDGWLDALEATFRERPDAGLVGARLVYPDGTLQECGGMVFSDGSGWNYGRGDDPDRPEYQALREVDYCSGACVMLRRDLFSELGGFDRHYAPAYYEDTDLAFKVREAGLKVYVQPRATIVHFEGVTSGTDLSSGTKRYQAVNREKFLERWQDALRQQPDPIVDPNDAAAIRAARDHRLAGRVLLVDAYTPEPDQDSGSVRLVNLMRCFQALGYGVSFFPDNRAWNGAYTQALQAMGVEAWYDPWLKSPESFFAAHREDFDLVIVSRHYIACNYLAPVRRLAPSARFVFDTVDLHYLREQRLAELEDSTTLRQVARQTRRSELSVIRDADATLVVSPVEQELLAEEAPDAEVFVVSNIHEVSGSATPYTERTDLYFVGGYQHPPNIDAAEWFVREIWPIVREQLPEVKFHLVGSKATDAVRALGEAEGVVFHGFVESLAPFLDRCRLSVAPLRYGAGVKGKVNQAMAHGQPVVATSAAVEGLGAVHGDDVLVADDVAGFADAVVQLYQDKDLWERLSEAGVRNVERNFSLEAAQRDLQRLLDATR
ncbi:MAG: glycosyltransferase [Pseudomonadota bacterium]